MSDFNIDQKLIQITKALYDNAKSSVLIKDQTGTTFRKTFKVN